MGLPVITEDISDEEIDKMMQKGNTLQVKGSDMSDGKVRNARSRTIMERSDQKSKKISHFGFTQTGDNSRFSLSILKRDEKFSMTGTGKLGNGNTQELKSKFFIKVFLKNENFLNL